jgi:hypothetical protein
MAIVLSVPEAATPKDYRPLRYQVANPGKEPYEYVDGTAHEVAGRQDT